MYSLEDLQKYRFNLNINNTRALNCRVRKIQVDSYLITYTGSDGDVQDIAYSKDDIHDIINNFNSNNVVYELGNI